MKLVASIDSRGLTLAGKLVERAEPAEWFRAFLGDGYRIEVPDIATDAPHLSNKFHVFDELGLILLEHHARHVIDQVALYFSADEAPRPLAHPFFGELSVLGVSLRGGETERELEKSPLIEMEAALHRWSFTTETACTTLGFARPRLARGGKRHGTHRLASVAFGITSPEHRAMRKREQGS